MEKNNFLEQEYGLTTDTVFKSLTATEEDLKMWVNREEEVKKWEKVLEDTKKTPNSNFLVLIIGDYGMGKSLSLLKIKGKAKEMGLYAVRLNFKSEEKPIKPGLDFLQSVFREINFKNINVTSKEINNLKKIYPDVGNVFEKIIINRQKYLLPGGQSNDIARLATAFIGGQLIPNQSQLRSLGAITKINNIAIAKEYLIGLLYLLKSSGFSTLVINADEFEYLFSVVAKSQQSIYLAVIRELFDLRVNIPKELRGMTANIVFFIAMSDDGWRRLDDLEKKERGIGGPINPLKRRITSNITLLGLSKKETEELIEKRLKYNRIKDTYDNEPLIPYTGDFVDYIFKQTLGAPGYIIKRCDHVLDRGLEQKVPRLTAEFAKEVFKERGFTY